MWIRIVIVAAVGLGATSAAEAAFLGTHLLPVRSGQTASCVATNVSRTPREVSIRLVSGNTIVGFDSDVLQPGRTLVVEATAAIGQDRRCEVEVQGSKEAVRAGLRVLDSAGNILATDPAR